MKQEGTFKYDNGLWVKAEPTDPLAQTGRFYEKDGKFYPSVTTFLTKTAKFSWINRWIEKVGIEEATRRRELGQERGTELHKIAEQYFAMRSGDTVSRWVTSKHWSPPLLRNFLRELSSIKTPVLVEQELVNEKAGYAGTVDLVAERFDALGTELTVFDLKSSSKASFRHKNPEYDLQVVAYFMAYKENGGYPVNAEIMTICAENGEIKRRKLEHFEIEFLYYLVSERLESFKKAEIHQK